eukprot:FR737456.1.p3 GENE.FR737456.1~~FR737456.1.p3  ORF type:complete len:126 (+),score=21.34 FR737456.1:704-1081(+)
MHAKNQTSLLVSDGYWASYNVAYYNHIRKAFGEHSSYTKCTPANLFREMPGNAPEIPPREGLKGWKNYKKNPLPPSPGKPHPGPRTTLSGIFPLEGNEPPKAPPASCVPPKENDTHIARPVAPNP